MSPKCISVHGQAIDELDPALWSFILQKDESSEPQPKRRKVEPDISPSHDKWADAVCLAHVRLQIAFPTSEIWQSGAHAFIREPAEAVYTITEPPPTPDAEGLIEEGFQLGLKTKTQKALGDLDVLAKISRKIKNVMRQAAGFQNDSAKRRAKTTLQILPEVSHQSLVLVIDLRIYWQNAQYFAQATQDAAQLQLLQSLVPEGLLPVETAWSPEDFYSSIYYPPADGPDAEEAATMTVPALSCVLFPFQKRTVQWMLRRELSSRATGESTFFASQDATGNEIFVSHWLGIVSTHKSLATVRPSDIKGGLLAEEMGLGKTVEVLALLLQNQRDMSLPLDSSLKKSASTVIISPQSIQQQWKSEIEEHAPGLKVMIYTGLRGERKQTEAQLIGEMLDHDVVLVSYNVLSSEIHFAGVGKEHNLRHAKQYEKKKSPLVQIDWWRCVLDECQMLESGVSQAAQVANQIPRQNAWAVSGTPLKKDAKDLQGLLMFLRLQPYGMLPNCWTRFTTCFKGAFKDVFSCVALRHSKEQVKADIMLPPQRRAVLSMSLTPVEEQHYTSLFEEMCFDCGLDDQGNLLDEGSVLPVEKMKSWLSRLRQTVLHPEVGERNRRVFGRNFGGSLRTVGEVLQVMVDQNEAALRNEERQVHQLKLKRGQMYEHEKQPEAALALWKEVEGETAKLVEDARKALADEEKTSDALEDEEEDSTLTRAGILRNRLRASLEILHHAIFFQGGGYFQLKDEEEKAIRQRLHSSNQIEAPLEGQYLNNLSKKPEEQHSNSPNKEPPDEQQSKSQNQFSSDEQHSERQNKVPSDEQHPANPAEIPLKEEEKSETFIKLEKQESEAYDRAKLLRKEILSDSQTRALSFMARVKARPLAKIPELKGPQVEPGLETSSAVERAERACRKLNLQAQKLQEWRAEAAKLLTLPLLDQSDDDLTGEEYEATTKAQDRIYVYVEVLRAVVADRHDAFQGQTNALIHRDMQQNLRAAREGLGHDPELMLKLLKEREEVKRDSPADSIRSIMAEFRSLKADYEHSTKSGYSRGRVEHDIASLALENMHTELNEHIKYLAQLDKEASLFREAMNTRLEYFRQLQTISDAVVPFEEDLGEQRLKEELAKSVAQEEKMSKAVRALKSRATYLSHLGNLEEPDGPRQCLICTDEIEIGILLACGHQFCKVCIRIWHNTHGTCPMCKKSIRREDLHLITYKPRLLEMRDEPQAQRVDAIEVSEGESLYSGLKSDVMAQIKCEDLPRSYGTKIDTLARHLKWLRRADPGAKSIIFSQYRDFLDILGTAFQTFRIEYTDVDDRRSSKGVSGIERFKTDPNVECFLLHAKAHSSGLNLVQATHVFLCEPLVNTALELQAVARVHRIGQQHATTVYMYLVEDTIEKAIYDIAVKRRMAHARRAARATPQESPNGKAKAHSALTHRTREDAIAAADSQSLRESALNRMVAAGRSGGEEVPNNDVWACLFSSKAPKGANASGQAEFGAEAQFLAGEAAQQRQVFRKSE